MFEDDVWSMIQQENMFLEDSRVLAAVSGGADSVCLFHVLRHLSVRAGFTLHVAHLHHMLRQSADEDERFVRQLCLDHGIGLSVHRVDVADVARRRGQSVEEAGRSERLAFLEQTAMQEGCSRVALGHHLDDQAETILQNLLRGAGSNGLGGMRPVRDLWCRPLLGVGKREIVDWLKAQGYTWREDETNREEICNRNRIRHRLVPLLQEFNPRITAHLAELGTVMKAEHDYLDEQMRRFAADHLDHWGTHCVRIRVEALEQCPPALRFRLWMECYRLLTGRGLERRYVLDLEADFRGPRSGLGLPGNVMMGIRKTWMVCYTTKSQRQDYRFVLEGPGAVNVLSGLQLDVSLVSSHEGVNLIAEDTGRCVVVDGAQAPWPWVIRAPLAKDGFIPSGSNRYASLRKMFGDRGLPGSIRHAMPVCCDGEGQVFWAGGLRMADRVRVGPATKQFIRIRVCSC